MTNNTPAPLRVRICVYVASRACACVIGGDRGSVCPSQSPSRPNPANWCVILNADFGIRAVMTGCPLIRLFQLGIEMPRLTLLM
jgi:hypothetical protein